MFDWLKSKPAPARAEPAVPPGQRVYAIGDIHGRADLLETLLAAIDTDAARRGAADTCLVLLGDLIDRGPDSRGVIDRALALEAKGAGFRAIQGNHEEVLLRTLAGDPAALHLLLRIGGVATLESYGIAAATCEEADEDRLLGLVAAALPAGHVAFLERMEDRVAIGDYLFVHAGIRPGIAIEEQRGSDLRWIRQPFLDHPVAHAAMIVHGHSITGEPDLRHNRLGIDTGAYTTGRLTALGLEGTDRWLLQT